MLLLDEPSLGLAPAIVESMYETFQKLHKDEGLSCLIEAAAGRVPRPAGALPGLEALIHDAGSRAGLLQARADLVAVKQRLGALLASH
jgi:hypothetical protein